MPVEEDIRVHFVVVWAKDVNFIDFSQDVEALTEPIDYRRFSIVLTTVVNPLHIVPEGKRYYRFLLDSKLQPWTYLRSKGTMTNMFSRIVWLRFWSGKNLLWVSTLCTGSFGLLSGPGLGYEWELLVFVWLEDSVTFLSVPFEGKGDVCAGRKRSGDSVWIRIIAEIGAWLPWIMSNSVRTLVTSSDSTGRQRTIAVSREKLRGT